MAVRAETIVLKKNNNQGFTLVELVTTMILIGILAVTVFPRLINVSGYSAYSVRNEVISELRAAQQRAVNNSDLCLRVNFNVTGYAVQQADRTAGCDTYSNIGNAYTWQDDLVVTSRGSQNFNVFFDPLGGIELSNLCIGDCITIVADDTVKIKLSAAGYINAD